MQLYYLLGIVFIGLGLRMVSKGYATKSTARMLLGLAIIPVGISQFFRTTPWLATTLIALALLLFTASLYMIKVAANAQRKTH
ncbi:MAG: hypothetical protein ABFD54_16390 [Armatimonadota bacterium]|nr:hypothetical protein [bacterium]